MVYIKRKEDLERIVKVTSMILDGLNGKPFGWGDGQRQAWVFFAQSLGITLVTENQIKKQKFRLKRGAKPVGSVYFGAPIQKYCDVYVRELQCVLKTSNNNLPPRKRQLTTDK